MADKMMRIAGRGQDGLAKPIQTDNEGSLSVIFKKLIGSKAIVRRRSGVLVAGNIEVMIDTSKPFILDYLEFSTDGTSCQLDVIYKGAGSEPERTIGLVKVDGSGFDGIRPSTITASGSGPFEIVEHNVTNNRYKYKLVHPIEFPEGCIIRVQNWLTTDQNVAVRFYGREYQ